MPVYFDIIMMSDCLAVILGRMRLLNNGRLFLPLLINLKIYSHKGPTCLITNLEIICPIYIHTHTFFLVNKIKCVFVKSGPSVKHVEGCDACFTVWV